MHQSEADPPPLLTYALVTQPNPPQVGMPVWLTLTATNTGSAKIVVRSITVTLPRGTNAKDLIGTADITATPPDGWTATIEDNIATFTAPGNGGVQVGRDGLVLTLAATINDQPGSSHIDFAETAGDDIKRSASIPVSKFPVDFSLSPLSAVPGTAIDILYGQPAYLMWTATGAGVTCTLNYQPANSGKPRSDLVPNTPLGSSYPSVPLTRTGDVAFTLVASMIVPGQDEPLTLQSILTVSVETLSLSLVVEPPSVGVGGLVRITWDAPNADLCLADDGQQLPASGTAYVILQATRIFTVTAVGAGGQTVQQQATVTVNPAIVPTDTTTATATGAAGAQGAQGKGGYLTEAPIIPGMTGSPKIWTITLDDRTATVVNDANGGYILSYNGGTYSIGAADYTRLMQPFAAGAGAAGGDARLAIALPPLDTSETPSRVIAISAAAGAGGAGGTGGGIVLENLPSLVAGGPGGAGGNAIVEISVNSSLAPAQYLVSLAAGDGGPGGFGILGDNGTAGANGTTAFAFDGVIVPPDGSLAAPRALVPQALAVSIQPMVVAPNGVALLRWDASGADQCILPDGSVVGPTGSRHVVVPKTQTVTVTAADGFGRTLAQSATVAVDPSILPSVPGSTREGVPGANGADGANVTGAGAGPPPTPGSPGDAGGDALISRQIPPLDTGGTSTEVIPLVATGGNGGTGGAGAWVIPPPELQGLLPDPFQLTIVCSAGGPGGAGGNATMTLTTDSTLAPAMFIVTATPGTGGTGGECGWRYDLKGNAAISYADTGRTGAATVTIDGQPVLLLAGSEG